MSPRCATSHELENEDSAGHDQTVTFFELPNLTIGRKHASIIELSVSNRVNDIHFSLHFFFCIL